MEPTMISLKVLSTAAAMALVLPMVAPTASFAQNPQGTKSSYAGRGAAPAARGAGAAVPAARIGGGGGAGFRPGGGGSVAQFNGGGYRGGNGGYGGGYRHDHDRGYEGGYRRDHDRDGGRGFIPGAVAGAVIGGAIASQSYGYYGGPDYAVGYDAPGYYDDQYYDDGGGVVAVAPAPVGGDDVAYCMQTYRSYDPASGTYLGYDGLRHPCP
jgi:hypothetical protein